MAEISNKVRLENLQLHVSEINIPLKLANSLNEKGINTVEDLLSKTADEIMDIPNVAKSSLDKIYLALEEIGFYRNHKV